MENLVLGVDVSEYEPRVDWRLLRSQGVRFAFIRATSGTAYVDRRFADHWAGAGDAGILRGAYHYLFAGEDSGRQAQLFISTVGSSPGELPPIVDLEDKYNEGVPAAKIISTCKAVLDLVEKAFKRKPIVYSRKSYLEPHFTQNGQTPGWAKDYDLWVAQYPFKFDPTIHPNVNMPLQPAGWKNWKFWQYSESAILEGVTGEDNRPTAIDLDWFRGTEAELYALGRVDPPVEGSYTVKEGDTFKSIADENQVTITELLAANPSLLKAGTTLTIPGRVSSHPIPPVNPDPILPSVVTHTVKRDEGLFGIALQYHTTVEEILKVNPQITNRSLIFEGQIIVIPS